MHLGLSTLEISKKLKHDFWYDYVKHNYQQNKKLCYMLTHSFIFNSKTEDVHEDIGNDIETRFHT